jgi:phospho-N-acetylmuramoyl-pentapeptide-transferase
MLTMEDHIFWLIKIFMLSGLAFIIAFALMPWFVYILKKYKIGKNIRDNALDGNPADLFKTLHQKKEGTPTMGGLLVWGAVVFVVVISRALSYFGVITESLLNRGEVYLPLFTLISVGLLGAFDDYLNVRGVKHGVTARVKMIWLLLFAIMGALWFYFKLDYSSIHIPRIGDFEIGLWYIPLFVFILLATSHSVNFTDGLDGLAGGLLMIAFGAFGVLSYAKGLFFLSAFCGVTVGSLGAFLWFNVPPAQVFMGDTGALSLGATLGVIAMMTDSMMVLPLIGFIFVIETLSIIIQLFSKKYFKRKVFHIAPVHHHFEHIGWPEHTIVMRFWIIGTVMAAMGLLIGLLGMGLENIF